MPEPVDPATLRSARALRFGAALLLIFGVGEALVVGQPVWGAIGTRLAWGACALGCAEALTRAGAALRAAAMGMLGGSAPFFYAALIEFHGGTQGVPFDFLAALPLTVSVLLLGEVVASATCALATPVVGLALLARAGADGHLLAEWGLAMGASSAIAFYGSVLTHRMLRSERLSQEARLEAQAQLALRERALAEADRLALVGQLAAGLSHEVNNPLATVISNTSYLEETLTGAGANSREVAEVLADIKAGARRIARVMQEIAASAPAPDSATEACALEAIVASALSSSGLPPGVVIESAVPQLLPRVHAAPSQLRRALGQLFAFLLESARHGVGGRVGRLRVAGREEGDRVVLEVRAEVSGEGPVVAPPGPVRAGLGLALIGESMRLWGGELATQSERGETTAVTLSFRRAS